MLETHADRPINRRQFGLVAGGTLATLALGGAWTTKLLSQEDPARVTARPRPGIKTTAQGERLLGLETTRDAILRMPAKVPAGPVPLMVLLHGAGGSADIQLRRMGTAPDEAGIAVLAPFSRDPTWDAIREDFGPDVAFLNRALTRVFELVAVDPARISIGGFSDGATYALSLGLINGDFFHRVVAWSPGFVADGTLRGKPPIFISHGTADNILPISRTSRRIVPELKQLGYDVTFREFDGGHEITPVIGLEGMRFGAKA